MSMFDPTQFLDLTIEGENSTVAVPPPVGEFPAMIDKVDVRQWTKRDDPTVSGLTLEVFWAIEDAGVKEMLGRDKVLVKQGIMLDITEAGGLDMGKGKNVGLGRLRAACNLNNPGQAFSFQQLPGQMAKVTVSHRPDKDDHEKIYPEIKTVVRA